MTLTDLAIKALKPKAKNQKISDGGGLQLVVSPSGGRSWKFAYRIGKKQRELTIGPYPAVSLYDARRRRDEAKRCLANGGDPSLEKSRAKLRRQDQSAETFDSLAAEVLEKKRREGKASVTIEKVSWLYSLAQQKIGSLPIADITAGEILAVLRDVDARGKYHTAIRLRAVIGEVFRYAIATGRAVNDPTFALRGALVRPQVKHRAAILNARKFGGLLRAVESFDGQASTVAALKLLAYLFPRPGELRFAEWAEFDFDQAIWTIPAARTKTRRLQRVPLPRQAISILLALRRDASDRGLVFRGLGRSGGSGRGIAPKPMSENTLNGALRRMGFSGDEMSSHGFRAAASSMLNESGRWSADAIERALGHQEANSVRRAYARGEHWDERVAMSQWWADFIDNLRDERVSK